MKIYNKVETILDIKNKNKEEVFDSLTEIILLLKHKIKDYENTEYKLDLIQLKNDVFSVVNSYHTFLNDKTKINELEKSVNVYNTRVKELKERGIKLDSYSIGV